MSGLWRGTPVAVKLFKTAPNFWAGSSSGDPHIIQVDGCFNSVLANAYRYGRDSMGWHSDDERELGRNPVIASLSLGAVRRFLLRSKQVDAGTRRASLALALGHGSLLIMQGDSQQRFQHSLPRSRQAAGLRINLTYRLVGVQAPV